MCMFVSTCMILFDIYFAAKVLFLVVLIKLNSTHFDKDIIIYQLQLQKVHYNELGKFVLMKTDREYGCS